VEAKVAEVEPPTHDKEPEAVAVSVETSEDAIVAAESETEAVEAELGDENCSIGPKAYCCMFGIACDCKAGMITDGQCGREAYVYCCMTGTPCMCSADSLPFLSVV